MAVNLISIHIKVRAFEAAGIRPKSVSATGKYAGSRNPNALLQTNVCKNWHLTKHLAVGERCTRANAYKHSIHVFLIEVHGPCMSVCLSLWLVMRWFQACVRSLKHCNPGLWGISLEYSLNVWVKPVSTQWFWCGSLHCPAFKPFTKAGG